VSRKTFRWWLVGLLVASASFAAWSWLRPYAWNPDPKARFRIVAAEVVADHSNCWLNLHLRIRRGDKDPALQQDLMDSARLITAGGREIKLADSSVLLDVEGESVREIWFKFWLEGQDFSGPLKLRINDGELQVRSGSGQPKLGNSERRNFVTSGW